MADNIGSGALAGLAGHYGSDSDEDAETNNDSILSTDHTSKSMWSICVDPSTGCPYYWDQITNQVSWELPVGVTVSANPIVAPAGNINKSLQNTSLRQPYKTGLNIKQNQSTITQPISNLSKMTEPPSSEEEDEKIELITSYYNSDSASGEENNDELMKSTSVSKQKNIKKRSFKKQKEITKALPYGPELPEEIKSSLINVQKPKTLNPQEKRNKMSCVNNPNNLNNSGRVDDNIKIGVSHEKVKEVGTMCNAPNTNDLVGSVRIEKDNISSQIETKFKNNENESSNEVKNIMSVESDNLDDLMVVQANLLKKLGELGPNDIKYLNGSVENTSSTRSRTESPLRSPAVNSPSGLKKSNALDMDVDDLIAQIEKEQPVDQPNSVTDIQSSGMSNVHSQDGSLTNKTTPTIGDMMEVKMDTYFKPLFPSVSFPSTLEKDNPYTKNISSDVIPLEKGISSKIDLTNDNSYKYETSSTINDGVENAAFKRKRRIAVDVLTEKKSKNEENLFKKDLSYSTKYAQNNEISGERIGLGFTSLNTDNDDVKLSIKNNYPNFTKGDTLDFKKSDTINFVNNSSSEKDDDDSKPENDDNIKPSEGTKTLIEAKLKFLVQNLPPVPPVQQLSVELQTLWSALSAGALQNEYMNNWLVTADSTLARLEASAVSYPWICRFHSGAGCYVYEHAETGKVQWEFPGNDAPPPPSSPPPVKPPAPPSPSPSEPTDMDISTTPPPQPHPDVKSHGIDSIEPLPPGVETPTRISSPCLTLEDKTFDVANGYKQSETASNFCNDKLGAELNSFYSDLAALEDNTGATSDDKNTASVPVVKKQQPSKTVIEDVANIKEKKKKLKLKVPGTMKDKTVSKLVEKWKKVQETLDN